MLIENIPDLMKYVEVSRDLQMISVTPSIKEAERRFIMPILGAYYNVLVDKYTNSSGSAIENQLIEMVNSATGPLAMWYYVQVGGVSIDNSGVYKPKNDQRWNLGENELKRLENALLNRGLNALDDLLNFLYTNLNSFPEYADSKQFEEQFNSLVPTASVVQTVFSLLHPFVTYRAMREAIRFVEPRVAGHMQEFHAHLVTVKETDLTLSERNQRDLARRAVIYLAISRALLTRTVILTNEGLEVMMGERTQISEPENARIEAASREFLRSGEMELQYLITSLNAIPPTGYVPPVVVGLADRRKCSEDSKILFI